MLVGAKEWKRPGYKIFFGSRGRQTLKHRQLVYMPPVRYRFKNQSTCNNYRKGWFSDKNHQWILHLEEFF